MRIWRLSGVLLFAVFTLSSISAAAQPTAASRVPRVSLTITQVDLNSSGQISVSGQQDCSDAVKTLIRSGALPENTALVLANVSYSAYQRTSSGLAIATYQSGRANPCWANTAEPPGVSERCVAEPDGTYHPCAWTTAVFTNEGWSDPGFISGTAPFIPGSVQVSADLEAGWLMVQGATEPQQFSPGLAATARRTLRAESPMN